MKILNLYAGIGGNRMFWSNKNEIIAVEHDLEIAAIYKENYPNDNVIIADVISWLNNNQKELLDVDFIWASPPCQTHTQLPKNYTVFKRVIPDLTSIYGLIIWFNIAKYYNNKLKYCIENVTPYYSPLKNPTVFLGRHPFWTNFWLPKRKFNKIIDFKDLSANQILEKLKFPNFELKETNELRKKQIVKNLVDPLIGAYILKCAAKNNGLGSFISNESKN